MLHYSVPCMLQGRLSIHWHVCWQITLTLQPGESLKLSSFSYAHMQCLRWGSHTPSWHVQMWVSLGVGANCQAELGATQYFLVMHADEASKRSRMLLEQQNHEERDTEYNCPVAHEVGWIGDYFLPNHQDLRTDLCLIIRSQFHASKELLWFLWDSFVANTDKLVGRR